jgi:probable HAF family extracellular repeat protein
MKSRLASCPTHGLLVTLLFALYSPTCTDASTLTVFNVPGADITNAFGINDAGQVVGFVFTDPNTHAFVRDAGGTFTTFDLPGDSYTRAFGINGTGEIVGDFAFALGSRPFGFIRTSGGA